MSAVSPFFNRIRSVLVLLQARTEAVAAAFFWKHVRFSGYGELRQRKIMK